MKEKKLPTEDQLTIAINALKKLAKPTGAFSRDPLTFAENTIADSTEIAEEALKDIEELAQSEQ